jgi:hypothetical protein
MGASYNAKIKVGCGHFGELNHETHRCENRCAWRDETIDSRYCSQCSIVLNLPDKKCFYGVT